MQSYNYSGLTFEIVGQLFDLDLQAGEWQPAQGELVEKDILQIGLLRERLREDLLSLMNEATVWDRAIYPLLAMAEQRPCTAWSQINLGAVFKEFSLTGYVDGVVGMSRAGHLVAPYLIVVEAKKRLEANNPQLQVYGAMLAAAKLNWEHKEIEPQTIYGCYTINDTWTFLRGQAECFMADKPRLTVGLSREYSERAEAETILQILKAIIHRSPITR